MDGSVVSQGEVKEISLEAVIIKADGTRIDLGTIARSTAEEPLSGPGVIAPGTIQVHGDAEKEQD